MSKRATPRNAAPLLVQQQQQQQQLPGTYVTTHHMSPRAVVEPAAAYPWGAPVQGHGVASSQAVTVQTSCAATVPRQTVHVQASRMQSQMQIGEGRKTQAGQQPCPQTPLMQSARGLQGSSMCATLVSRTVEHYSLQMPVAPQPQPQQQYSLQMPVAPQQIPQGQCNVQRQEQPPHVASQIADSLMPPLPLSATQVVPHLPQQHASGSQKQLTLSQQKLTLSQQKLTQSQQIEVQVECDTILDNLPEAVEEVVPGLRAFFDAAKLRHYHEAAITWCEEAGAVEMLEIFEALDELAEALGLKVIEKRRLRKMADHWRADRRHGSGPPVSARDSSDASSVAQSQSQPTNMEDAVYAEEIVTAVAAQPASEVVAPAAMPLEPVDELAAVLIEASEPDIIDVDRPLALPRDSLISLVGGLEALETASGTLGAESLNVTAESDDVVEDVLPGRRSSCKSYLMAPVVLDHHLGPRPPPSPLERAPVYGLDAELEAKAAAKYDAQAELEAACWVQGITGVRVVGDFSGVLRDGQILCELANCIRPGIIAKVNAPGKPFRERENISHFLRACRTLGVQEYALFSTDDLYDKKNMMSVVRCIHALGGAVQRSVVEFQGPRLGVADTSHAKRDSRRELAPVTQTGGFHASMEKTHLDVMSGQIVRGGC